MEIRSFVFLPVTGHLGTSPVPQHFMMSVLSFQFYRIMTAVDITVLFVISY